MKIVIGADVFYPLLDAGGEVHTYNIAKHLVRFGHEVTVIAGKSSQFPDDPESRLTSLKDSEYADGIQIIRPKKPYRYGSTVASVPALYEMHRILDRMIKGGQVDIANFLMYRPAVPFYLTARGRVPTVLITHFISESYGSSWKGWRDYDGGLVGGIAQKVVEDTVLRFNYDRIMAVSSTQREKLLRNYPEEKIDLVYNGVDLEKYDAVTACQKDPDQLIFVGTLKKRKNVLEAIEAVRQARGISKRNLKLVIVSSGGEQEQEVLHLQEKLGFIKYYRRVSDEQKIRLLKESSLFVFPTLREGFPLVTIEGLACGTPSVVYNIPEMNEVADITGGVTTVPCGDIGLLSRTICDLISNELRLKSLSSAGRKSVERLFTWEAVARREEKTFKAAIEAFNKRK